MVGGVHRTSGRRRSVSIKGHTRKHLIQIWNVLQKWYRGRIVFILSFRRTDLAKSAREEKITRAPCRKRTGDAVLRAENFGYLITADHKVVNEGCESRNNHRYAVMEQDLATQWILSYPCKTKTSQETERSLRKFLEPSEKPSSIRCRGTRLGYTMDRSPSM